MLISLVKKYVCRRLMEGFPPRCDQSQSEPKPGIITPMLPSHSYIMIAQDRHCQYQILNTFLLLTIYGHIFGCKPNKSVNLHTVKLSILKKGILISNFHKHKEVCEITITFIHEHNWQYYSSFGSKTISMCGSPSGILLFMKQTGTSSYQSSLLYNPVP